MKRATKQRKDLTPRKRFEILKRDLFTCQYCGGAAPDVELHVDHIHPVSKGGANNKFNLVTACKACNLAKSARPLTGDALAEIQKRVEQNEGRFEQNKRLIDEMTRVQRQREVELDRLRFLVSELQGENKEMKNEIEWQRNMLSWKNKMLTDKAEALNVLKDEMVCYKALVERVEVANLWQRIFKTW